MLQTKQWLINQLKGDSDGDKWGHRYRGVQYARFKSLEKIILNTIDIKQKYDILDIGCSHGDFTKIIKNDFVNSSIFATDIAVEAIEATKEYLDLKNNYVEVSTLPEIAFSDKLFDIIFSIEVLYYLNKQDRIKSVEDIYQKLNNNGYYIFTSVIDDGSRYFTENDAIDLISSKFKIIKVDYIYTKLAVKFESIFIKIENFYKVLNKIDKDYKCGNPTILKKFIISILKNNIIKNIVKMLLYPFYFISKKIVRNKNLMYFITKITKKYFPKQSKAIIVIIGRKVIDEK